MCCQPHIKASVYNIVYSIFFTAYFLTQYFLNNEYYLGDLCMSPYLMLSIGILYFISGFISMFMIKKSKFFFPYMLYIFNLAISIIGLLHFAACTIPVNVIANATYEFFNFIPPIPIYVSQIACYVYFIKWLKNKIYEKNEKNKSKVNRQRQEVELKKTKLPTTTLKNISIVEQEGFISI